MLALLALLVCATAGIVNVACKHTFITHVYDVRTISRTDSDIMYSKLGFL